MKFDFYNSVSKKNEELGYDRVIHFLPFIVVSWYVDDYLEFRLGWLCFSIGFYWGHI